MSLDFPFTDDCILIGNTAEEMQYSLYGFSADCNNFRLAISTEKTKVMLHSAPGSLYVKPHFTVNEQYLNVVSKFTYLGNALSRAVHVEYEVTNHIAKATGTGIMVYECQQVFGAVERSRL